MTDLERFNLIDEVRRACDALEVPYEFDGRFTREDIAWIFEKAWLQITRERLFTDLEYTS